MIIAKKENHEGGDSDELYYRFTIVGIDEETLLHRSSIIKRNR